MIPAEPQHPDGPWMKIEKRIAELLHGGPAPTDPEDTRLAEYRAPLDALDRLEWEEGVRYRKENSAA